MPYRFLFAQSLIHLILFNLVTGKKNFYFRGCGWANKAVSWSTEDKIWITAMNQLFESLYGKDTLKYVFVQGQGSKVDDSDSPMPVFYYDHKLWEENYESYIGLIQSDFPKSKKSLTPQLDMCPLQPEMSSSSTESEYVTVGLPGTSLTEDNPTLHIEGTTDNPGISFNTITDDSSPSRGDSPMSTSLSSSSGIASISGSVAQNSATHVAHADLTTTVRVQSPMTCHLEAWLTTVAGLTRRGLSNIAVPPPAAECPFGRNVTAIFGTYLESDPLSLKERPAERLVDEAEKAFRSDPHSHQSPAAVSIGNVGTFSRDGISVLRKFCEISSLKLSVVSEQRWLTENHDGLSVDQISCIKEVLWDRRTGESILRAGRKSLDVSSFSTLVGERYVDNFVIDVTIWHYLQECLNQGSLTRALCLPSETHTWLGTNSPCFIQRKLEQVMSNSRREELDVILCPLHMNESHWGLIVIDLLNGRLLFDDGYKLQPDASVLPNIKYVLDIFQRIRPAATCFQNSFWNSINQFERFGMPSQHGCARAGQDTGSCGVGVILAARDFLHKGVEEVVYQFGWSYTEMRPLRKQLMIQILKWGSM